MRGRDWQRESSSPADWQCGKAVLCFARESVSRLLYRAVHNLG